MITSRKILSLFLGVSLSSARNGRLKTQTEHACIIAFTNIERRIDCRIGPILLEARNSDAVLEQQEESTGRRVMRGSLE
jgi:hypothetical protein